MVSNIFYFHPEIWGRFPFWLIFFRWVATTSQKPMNEPPFLGMVENLISSPCMCWGKSSNSQKRAFRDFPPPMGFPSLSTNPRLADQQREVWARSLDSSFQHILRRYGGTQSGGGGYLGGLWPFKRDVPALEVSISKVNGSMGGYNLLINGGIPWGYITHFY